MLRYNTVVNASLMIDSNASASRCFPIEKPELPATIFFGIVVPIFNLLGVIGNIFNIIVFSDRRRMSSPTYIYLNILSYSHAVVLVCQAYYQVGVHFLYDKYWAIIVAINFTWPASSYGASLSGCLIAATSVERYLCASSLTPPSKVLLQKKQSCARRVIGILAVALLFINAPVMGAYMFDEDQWCYSTRWKGGWYRWYLVCRYIGLNIVAVIFILIFQFLLVRFLFRKADRSSVLLNQNCMKILAYRRRERTATLAVTVSGIFNAIIEVIATMFNPITVVTFWADTGLVNGGSIEKVVKVFLAIRSLQFSSSFLFYLIFNDAFKQTVVQKIFCMRKLPSNLDSRRISIMSTSSIHSEDLRR